MVCIILIRTISTNKRMTISKEQSILAAIHTFLVIPPPVLVLVVLVLVNTSSSSRIVVVDSSITNS